MKLRDGLFLGLLLGGLAAILYAPKSGKELREDLKEKLDNVPNSFMSLLESVADLMSHMIDFVSDTIQEQKEKVSDAVHTGIDAAKEKASELKSLALKR